MSLDTAGDGLADAARSVADGSTIAFGGVGLNRKPLAFAAALADRGARDLVVVSYLGSLEVEILLAGGCIAELHSSGVSLEGAGMAPRYRRARQDASVRFVEWSEGSLFGALDAASRGLPSMPTRTSPRSQVVESNPWLTVSPDPFTGEDIVVARALAPDVAVLHAGAADRSGNLYLDGDPGIDDTLSRAGTRVLATVEEITSRPVVEARISRLFVDEVLVIPNGSWPTPCFPVVVPDLAVVEAYAASGGEVALLRRAISKAGGSR